MIPLADVFSRFDPGVIGWAIFAIVGAAIAWAAIMAGLNGTRQFFGRNPPIHEDLRIYSATVAKLQTDLAKLPDDKKFAELVSRLDTFATVTQIAALQETFHREVKNVDAYAHNEVHRLGNEVNALQLGFIDRGERLASVEADLRTIGIGVRDLNIKLDKVEDRIGDKIIDLVRNGTLRGGARA